MSSAENKNQAVNPFSPVTYLPSKRSLCLKCFTIHSTHMEHTKKLNKTELKVKLEGDTF